MVRENIFGKIRLKMGWMIVKGKKSPGRGHLKCKGKREEMQKLGFYQE
jgi:hypothetical protein